MTFEAKQAAAILNALEAWIDAHKACTPNAVSVGYDHELGRYWASMFGSGGAVTLVHGETMRDALAQLAQIAALEEMRDELEELLPFEVPVPKGSA